ncbi:molybdopterin-synthase adenylyltransferase MoeB [Emcibacter sp. SYSU 3D8]|uniref:HesA/MoeB/ThiF family protein n=1 Tax=Emcibacter sp. SYSU 3D8 TaxID=3133969 RepID=UPI0031FEC5AF
MDFSDDQIERYARHIILKEIGGAGQQKLLAAKVMVVGAGGLGSPLLMYLAAAGVGTLGIVDDDTVSLSNLQRQILHQTADIGRPKTESAAETLAALNPDVTVILHEERLNAANALTLVAGYDLVADGSDNFETRFLVNDACYLARVPLVSAAIGQFEGQLSTYRAFEGENPCYRCVFPERPPPGTVPSCAEAGVIGALAGVMGSLQAVEAIKEITGIGQSMAGRLTIYDALDARFRTLKLRRDPGCALCGEHATIHDLTAHAA